MDGHEGPVQRRGPPPTSGGNRSPLCSEAAAAEAPGGEARARAVTAAVPRERGAQPGTATRAELRGAVVELERIVPAVIELAIAVRVLHIGRAAGAQCGVALGLALGPALGVRVPGQHAVVGVLDQQRAAPVARAAAAEQRLQRPAVAGAIGAQARPGLET